MQSEQTKPNGPVAAVFLASGIGCLVLGINVVLNELGGDISKFFAFDKNFGIGSGVGALSGKVIVAVIAFLVSWLVLHFLWRGKEVRFGTIFTVSLVLVAAGFLLTFPPVFDLFAPKA